jgi:hypothetical protein
LTWFSPFNPDEPYHDIKENIEVESARKDRGSISIIVVAYCRLPRALRRLYLVHFYASFSEERRNLVIEVVPTAGLIL